jgi:thiopeptide-type bacteriocin biosynthesis protein
MAMTVVDGPAGIEATSADWTSLHCFVHWAPDDADDFVVRALGPFMTGLRDDGVVADWFFIRYHENGPHLRVRARCTSDAVAASLGDRLAGLVAAADHPPASTDRMPSGWYAHGDVRPIPYEPEVFRYGGAAAIPVAEEVFAGSTRVALAAIEDTRFGSERLTVAADLAVATADALSLGDVAAASWLRGAGGAWRWSTYDPLVPPNVGHRTLTGVLQSQSSALTARWERVRSALADPSTYVAHWAACVRSARARLEGEAERDAPVHARWHRVWASQLHMLFNRLGVTPDEERTVCWLVAGSLLSPAGIAPYFDDSAAAGDRRYQEASKYAPGLLGLQVPRANPGYVATGMAPHPGPASSLPWCPPDASLVRALQLRRSARRGRIVGPLRAEQIGTLLWTSHNAEDDYVPSADARPTAYPSAGASYAARLRLLVFDVDGIEPGTYQVDARRRQLRRLGAAASRDDLEASSMWYKELGIARGGLDVERLPAMLGLYVELGRLRATYGVRALRFGLLEAGHLAQNLALVAAATGLSISMTGGFYDDLAHELLGLDGVDEVLTYLLPVGATLESELHSAG